MTFAEMLVDDYLSLAPRYRTAERLEQMVNEALEEAAKVCDDEFRVHVGEGCSCSGAEDCAERIRSMKRNTVTPESHKLGKQEGK